VATPKSPDHAALGAALREFREGGGYTLEALGDRAVPSMNPRYVSACERGEINVSWANLLRLCAALGISPSAVVDRYEELRPAARRRRR
jgi:transcriptional regulator with XRE-family HTH domain